MTIHPDALVPSAYKTTLSHTTHWHHNNLRVITPSQCVSAVTTIPKLASKPEAPMPIESAHTTPDSGSSYLSPSSSTTSSLSNLSSPTSGNYSNSDSEPLANEASVRSDWQLWPRWPINYKKTALRCLDGRPQVWTLNSLSLPLPYDPESNSNQTSLTMEIKRRSQQQAVWPHRFHNRMEHPSVTQLESPMI